MEIAKIFLGFIQALAWPVTTVVLLCIFRKSIIGLIPKMKNAELPGGLKLSFQEGIEIAEQKMEKVKMVESQIGKKKTGILSASEANQKMLQHGLRPVPSGLRIDYFREIVEQDPNLALAGLRIEITILMENLLVGWEIEKGKNESVSKTLQKLYDHEAISSEQFELARDVLQLCNKAVHGERITKTEANRVIDIFEILVEQYIWWLTWGFDKETNQTGKDNPKT
jgi:hypothetical protein